MNHLNRVAVSATIHCLTGCSIGEVMGMVIGNAANWSTGRTIAVSVTLAFLFGYALTMRPLLASGRPLMSSAKLALAADTASIAIMEIVDNLVMVAIPGAMESALDSAGFWLSLALSLILAGSAAFPVNRWLIARGRGHAVVHHANHHGAG
jgi:uncharacterized membrane protein